jgi:gliding motility-associated-like protein
MSRRRSIDFFGKYFNSEVRFLKTQYFCWCDTQDVQSPPECCVDLVGTVDIQVESGKTTICPGETLTLRAEPGSSNYIWSTGAIGVDFILVTEPGVYAVSVTDECGTRIGSVALAECPNEICDNLLDDDGDGLVDLDDLDCPCNNNIPPLNLSINGPADPVPIGTAFQLKAITNRPLPLVKLTWAPAAGLDCATCPVVESLLFDNTTFVLAATDTFGCQAETTFEVLVDKTRQVYAPNAFSPETDGENSLFKLFPGKGIEAIRQLRVYDRWGTLVYEGVTGWNGFVGGEAAPPGVYVWYAELKYFGDGTGILEGDVTLIR